MSNKVLFIFIISLILYLSVGLNAPLQRDPGIYVYSAQRVSEGIPPYKSIFDHKSPGAPLLLGGALKVYRMFSSNILGEILFLRILTIILISLIPVILFLIAKEFLGEKPAFISALVFITFWGFSYFAAGGPRPKSFMLLFEVLFLYLMIKRNYFWAGFFASAAAIVWQPLILFCLAGLYLSIKEKRAMAFIWGGSILPILTVIYFLYHGALSYLWEGAVVFNLKYLMANSLMTNLYNIKVSLLNNYRNSVPFILLGVFFFPFFLLDKKTHKILLYTFPLPILWSLADFQGAPDLYPLLPYAALGMGYLIKKFELKKVEYYTLIILLILIAFFPIEKNNTLKRQYEEVRIIKKRFKGRIATIGAPHFMALAGIKNPSRYVFILRGIDRKIEKEYSGGIKGWLNFLSRKNPRIIVFGQTKGQHAPEIRRWLNKNFHRVKRKGYFKIYLKK